MRRLIYLLHAGSCNRRSLASSLYHHPRSVSHPLPSRSFSARCAGLANAMFIGLARRSVNVVQSAARLLLEGRRRDGAAKGDGGRVGVLPAATALPRRTAHHTATHFVLAQLPDGQGVTRACVQMRQLTPAAPAERGETRRRVKRARHYAESNTLSARLGALNQHGRPSP